MKLNRRARLESQLSAYLDGELTPAERREVEERLQTDTAAQRLLKELRTAAGLLHDLPRATAGPGLAEGVRNRLERKALLGDSAAPGYAPEPPALSRSRSLAAAAVIALAMTTGYLMWSFREPPGGGPVRMTDDFRPFHSSQERQSDDSPLVLNRERSAGRLNLEPAARAPGREESPIQTPEAESAARSPADEAAPPAAAEAIAVSTPQPVDTARAAAEPPPDAMREQTVVVELAYADASGRDLARQLLSDRRLTRAARSEPDRRTADAPDPVLVDVSDAAAAMEVLAELSRTRPLTMKLMMPSDVEDFVPAMPQEAAADASHPPTAGADARSGEGSTKLGFLELARIQVYVERLRRVLEENRFPQRSPASTGDRQEAQAAVPADSGPAPVLAQDGESAGKTRDAHESGVQAVPPVKGMPALMTLEPSRPAEAPMAAAAPPAIGPAAPAPDVAATTNGAGLRVRIRWMTPEQAPATAPAAR